MQIQSFEIEGFRSLRRMLGKLARLTVLVGPNGVGKSNLYRSFELLSLAAERQLARAIAGEGGMDSVRWAGAPLPDAKGIQVRVHVVWDELEYELIVGEETVPKEGEKALFPNDPYIKNEKIWFRVGTRVEMVRRMGQKLLHRDDEGGWQEFESNLATNESMLCQLREPQRFPAILQVRNAISRWRFYHTFRTDPESPLRMPQVAYKTATLDGDGSNLAAMVLSILAGKGRVEFAEMIDLAMPGARVEVVKTSASHRQVGIRLANMNRVWVGKEISDGTLRLIALATALLPDEPPELMILNEPETSLHPHTFPALAKGIELASQRSQMLVVTHSQALADAIASLRPTTIRTLRHTTERGTELDTQPVVSRGKHTDE
jgi:predicted ATPase